MLKHRPIPTATAVEVCRTIKGAELDIRKTPGTVLGNDVIQEVICTSPEGEDVLRSGFAKRERCIHQSEDIDPLIRLAVMHYQFEAIRPLIDGNGRAGHILNLLYLVDRGPLDIPVLYLSRYVIRNKALHHRRLLGVTARRLGVMDTFHAGGCQGDGAMDDREIHAIREILDQTGIGIRQQLPKVCSRELAELILVHPCCRIS